MKKNSDRVNEWVVTIQSKAMSQMKKVMGKLQESDGNFVEEALKYVIAIVIGGVLLTGLCRIFNVNILKGLEDGVNNLFNYKA
ncbi:DUF6133 family protein [Anaeromicropila populeti]|uniref:Uncharacterized protein n=1 Tax=Anaeromicropila populeti TaxID=37658 RepID=A0A1I6JF48_9FIRM|nr:DUF6133 family protein [Anaeromicropila populeti]SFR77596.1 hypothetical protein SAMN05661086_01631 [Anaeromicropila populeti]